MVKKIQINMSNKSFYSLIVFGVLILAGIGVYAYNSGADPSVMGHSIDEIEGLGSLMDNYYTKSEVYTQSEVYTKEQIDAMISTIESGGTGCPVGYTLYKQSTETAKCYKDGKIITILWYAYGTVMSGRDWQCEGRINSGNLQTRATSNPGDYNEVSSGWVDGTSETYQMYYPQYRIRCVPNWKGMIMQYENSVYGTPMWRPTAEYHLSPKGYEVSWGNVLQIN